VPVAPATSDVSDVKNGPLAKAGQDLIKVYEESQAQGGSPTFTSSLKGLVDIEGTYVGIEAHSSGGDFNAFVSAMKSLGMQMRATDAGHGIAEGLLPISQLLAAAQQPQMLSITPIYLPTFSSTGTLTGMMTR